MAENYRITEETAKDLKDVLDLYDSSKDTEIIETEKNLNSQINYNEAVSQHEAAKKDNIFVKGLKKIGNKAVALFNKQPKALRNAELVGFIVVVIAAGSIGQLIKTGGNDITKTGNEITSSYVDQNKQDSNKAIEDDKEQEQEEVELEAQDPGEKIDGTRTIDKHRNYSENGKIKDKMEVTKKVNDPTKSPAKAETTTGSKENKIVDNTPSEKTEKPSGSTNYQKGMEDKNKGAQQEANGQRAGGDTSRDIKQETQPQKEIKSEEAKPKETPAETKSVTPQTPAPEVEKPSQNNYTMDENDFAELSR